MLNCNRVNDELTPKSFLCANSLQLEYNYDIEINTTFREDGSFEKSFSKWQISYDSLKVL